MAAATAVESDVRFSTARTNTGSPLSQREIFAGVSSSLFENTIGAIPNPGKKTHPRSSVLLSTNATKIGFQGDEYITSE